MLLLTEKDMEIIKSSIWVVWLIIVTYGLIRWFVYGDYERWFHCVCIGQWLIAVFNTIK